MVIATLMSVLIHRPVIVSLTPPGVRHSRRQIRTLPGSGNGTPYSSGILIACGKH
jgi:hypothetical protein